MATPITFQVKHLDHYGATLLTTVPVRDSLEFTYNLANIGGPSTISCDFALSDPALYSDAFAPYKTDFELDMVVGDSVMPLMKGPCTGYHLESDQGIVSFAGKDWLHWLEQPYPFDYTLNISQWASLVDSSLNWNENAGTDDSSVTYNATQQMLVNDLISALTAAAYDPIAPALAPVYLGSTWTRPINYRIPWGDTTNILDHLRTISRMYDPYGFDFWCVANPDKQVLLNGPRVVNPASIAPVAILTGSDKIMHIDYANNGPRATETVVMGSGTGNGRPWYRDTYQPSQDQYRRWRRIVSIQNPRASITSTVDVVRNLAAGIGYFDRFPQKELILDIKPDAVMAGDESFFYYPYTGFAVSVDYTGFGPFHHIVAYFYVTSQQFKFDAAGNSICRLTLDQIYV